MKDAYWLQIHWFSIINSCVTVLLLTGFLATILMRVLRKDFLKYTRDDEGTEAIVTCRMLLHFLKQHPVYRVRVSNICRIVH